MRTIVTGLLAAAAVALVAAQPANAAIVVGAFSGTVTSGEAFGSFGFAAATNLTGKTITGTFRYDTDLLGPNCPVSTTFFGCFLGTGMSVTQTINGVTEVFTGSPLAGGDSLPFNMGQSGVLLYDLVGDTVNLHTRSMIGDPATVYNARDTGLAFGLAPGGVGDTGNPVLTYDGPGGGPIAAYNLEGQVFSANHSEIYQVTAGSETQFTTYDFTIDRVTMGVTTVPEPGAWALMILGFGGVGAVLRRSGRRAGPVSA